MADRLELVGVDPGFASLGLARVALVLSPNGRPRAELLDVRVVETKKSDKKHSVYASDDNVRRLYELHDVLVDYLAGSGSRLVGLAVESMSFPRNASAAGKMSLAWGVLGAIARRSGYPILQTSPQDVKVKVAGARNASKDDIQEALRKVFPGELDRLMAPIPRSKHEHPADALAVAVASLDSEVVAAALRASR